MTHGINTVMRSLQKKIKDTSVTLKVFISPLPNPNPQIYKSLYSLDFIFIVLNFRKIISEISFFKISRWIFMKSFSEISSGAGEIIQGLRLFCLAHGWPQFNPWYTSSDISIPGIPYGPPALPDVVSEHRARLSKHHKVRPQNKSKARLQTKKYLLGWRKGE